MNAATGAADPLVLGNLAQWAAAMVAVVAAAIASYGVRRGRQTLEAQSLLHVLKEYHSDAMHQALGELGR